MRIGVLALQGAFGEHVNMLERIGVEAVLVKTEKQLSSVDGLIIPGGESTAIALIAERNQMMEPLREWVKSGKPVWGTCAGMILLSDAAHNTKEGGQQLIGGLHVQVKRNAFGHQLESFVKDIEVDGIGVFEGVFIRAPVIEGILEGREGEVQVVARVVEKGNEWIVGVKQGNILGTSFHPELTRDSRIHEEFLRIVRESMSQ